MVLEYLRIGRESLSGQKTLQYKDTLEFRNRSYTFEEIMNHSSKEYFSFADITVGTELRSQGFKTLAERIEKNILHSRSYPKPISVRKSKDGRRAHRRSRPRRK